MKSEMERIRVLMTWVTAVGVVLVFTLGSPKWERWPVWEEIIFFFGTFLAGIGAIGRAWCAVFISGRKDGELVRLGPYAMCRNPLYFFSFIGGLGIGFATETFTVPCFLALIFLFYYPFVIRSEERRLEQLFGDDFRAYRREVPCFFPNWRLLKGAEPNQYPVNTRTVRRSLGDILWFIWLIGLIEIISALHEIGFLPSLFPLY